MKLPSQLLCWQVAPFASSASLDCVCLRGRDAQAGRVYLRLEGAALGLFFFSYQLLRIFKIISHQAH